MTLGWKVLWPFLWFYLVIKNGLKTSKFRVKKSYDFTKKIKYCTAEVGPYKDGTIPKIYSLFCWVNPVSLQLIFD